jgi:hypothetical protein
MKREYSDVNELLSLICQQAVLDPALYKPWPTQMIAGRLRIRGRFGLLFTIRTDRPDSKLDSTWKKSLNP